MLVPTRSNRLSSLLTCLMALLIGSLALYVRVRLISTPLERDEGEYAYTAQLILKGIAPYSQAYTMKLPGVALVYALFISIFGQSAEAVRIGLLLVNAACAGLVYLLGRRLAFRDAAISAASFYALLSLSQSVLGVFAHATHLVVLFSLAGILLLDRALNMRRPLLIFLAGISFGMAILMKQHAAILIPFALFFQIWLQGDACRKTQLRHGVLFLAGAAIPYITVCLWLLEAGVFARFWFWTIQYAGQYTVGLSLTEGLGEFNHQFYAIVSTNLPVWFSAAAGVVALCRGKAARQEKLFFTGYLMASFAMVCPGLYFRPHYFVVLLPAIAIFAGYAVHSASSLVPGRLGALLPSLFMATAIGCFLFLENAYLFRLSPVEVSRQIYNTNPFPEAIPIADYLRRHTGEQERIAILGSEPEILFYAGRLSATGHIYMYGLMEEHRYAAEMQQQLISEIEAQAPPYIVVVHCPTSWLLKAESLNKILDWGDSYIPLRYDEVGIVDIFGNRPSRYLWGEAVAGHEPEAESFVSVFRRRW